MHSYQRNTLSTDSDRRRKIMNLNINLKYLFYSNEIRIRFFLLSLVAFVCFSFVYLAHFFSSRSSCFTKIVCEMKNLIYRASLLFNYVLRPDLFVSFQFLFVIFFSFCLLHIEVTTIFFSSFFSSGDGKMKQKCMNFLE